MLRPLRSLSRLLLAALLVVFFAACEDSDVTFDSSGLHASFSTDRPSPDALDVDLAEGPTSDENAGIQVRVTSTQSVQAVLFTLSYDTSQAKFSSWSTGSLFEQGGVSPFYSVTEVSSGFVQVEVRRPAADGPVDAVGTEPVVRLNFEAREKGDSRLDFLPPAQATRMLQDAFGASIGGVEWFGGTFRAE